MTFIAQKESSVGWSVQLACKGSCAAQFVRAAEPPRV